MYYKLHGLDDADAEDVLRYSAHAVPAEKKYLFGLMITCEARHVLMSDVTEFYQAEVGSLQ